MKNPLFIDWAITSRCNLNCIHCRGMNNNELQKEEIIKIAQEIKELYPEWVIIEGGEPLLKEEIWEVFDILNSVYLITNATLITDDNIKKLKNKGIKVMVSIDSPNPNIYENIRLGANFNEVIKNCELLSKNDLLHAINLVLAKYNYKDIKDIFYLAKNLDAKVVNIIGIKPCEEYKKNLLSKEEYKIAIINASEATYDTGVDLFFDEPFFLPATKEWGIAYHTKNRSGILVEKKSTCIFGEYIFIEPDGEIKPCTFTQYIVGNVKNGIKNVWEKMQNSKFIKKIKEIRTGECKECKYFYDCGGCRSRTFYIKNDWFESDPACPLFNKI